MIIFILISTLFFILCDEYIMGATQRRFGPLNVGGFGILASVVNGLNLIISSITISRNSLQQVIPFVLITIIMTTCFTLYYLLISRVADSIVTLLIFSILLSFNVIFLILIAYIGLSKYNVLGSIRVVCQLLSFELIMSTIIVILFWSYNGFNVSAVIVNTSFNLFNFPLLLVGIFLICILVESNRIPFDLFESESELVAGFITELSAIWFSSVLLVEYSSLVVLVLFFITLMQLNILTLGTLLFYILLLRSTVNRMRYDELMAFGWTNLLPIVWLLLILLVIF